MKKIITLLIFMMILTGCKTTHTSYDYYGTPRDIREKKLGEKFKIRGYLIDSQGKKSYLSHLSIFEHGSEKRPTIVSSKIKIIENGKEHIIREKKGTASTYLVYKNGVKISPESFIVEFGKIKLGDGTIIELPPIKFIKYVEVSKVNHILDALNQNTVETPFQGTIEEYREWKKGNK